MAAAMKDIKRVKAKAAVEQVRVDLPGRLFIPADEREAPCKIIDLSPDEASVECETVPESGTPVVLYVDGLSRFEGTIAHKNGNAFRVQFVCTAAKRERTAEQISAFLSNGSEGGSILRRHERSSQKGCIQFTRADGQIVSCEVVDISVSGVSLKTDIRPYIGEFVLIAQIAGRVSRYHEQGIGVEFIGKEP
ncbi:MAG TPA: PilZ domain-containing protein [Rhizomicrobium sp.]|jgi:hypothetical protein|nr:PilZ domain-containing protein [Rhizomicrobium sp.]